MTRVDLFGLAGVVALLLTMPLFAVLGRDRPMDVDVAGRPTTVLFGS